MNPGLAMRSREAYQRVFSAKFNLRGALVHLLTRVRNFNAAGHAITEQEENELVLLRQRVQAFSNELTEFEQFLQGKYLRLSAYEQAIRTGSSSPAEQEAVIKSLIKRGGLGKKLIMRNPSATTPLDKSVTLRRTQADDKQVRKFERWQYTLDENKGELRDYGEMLRLIESAIRGDVPRQYHDV
jgi:hypothetical protein